jgi:hypothetical protein
MSIRLSIVVASIALGIGLTLPACHRYLETPTSGAAPAPYREVQPVANNTLASMASVPDQAKRPHAEDARADFAQRYAAQGHPRIMIFFGRKLDGDPRVFNPNRSLLLLTMHTPSAQADKSEQREFSGTLVAVATPSHGSNQPAVVPNEFIAAVSHGMTKTMLDHHVRLVDPAMVVRREAVQASGDALHFDAKSLEIKALDNSADLLVEVIGDPGIETPHDCRLTARIIDIKSGQILALVTPDEDRPVSIPATVSVSTEDYAVVSRSASYAVAHACGVELGRAVLAELMRVW